MKENVEKTLSFKYQKNKTRKVEKQARKTEEFLPCITSDVNKLVSIPGTKKV